MNRPNPTSSRPVPPSECDAATEQLGQLSARELLAKLARVEDSLRTLRALPTGAGGRSHDRRQRPLRQQEHAIMDELTARRHRRGLIAAPLASEEPVERTRPPWA
jgi:hypothetical protein